LSIATTTETYSAFHSTFLQSLDFLESIAFVFPDAVQREEASSVGLREDRALVRDPTPRRPRQLEDGARVSCRSHGGERPTSHGRSLRGHLIFIVFVVILGRQVVEIQLTYAAGRDILVSRSVKVRRHGD
jgi:hypothetical protein